MKTDYNIKIAYFENKIPSVTSLVTTTCPSTKAKETENKIPNSNNLATKAAYNTKTTEIKKIPDTASFLTKAIVDFNSKDVGSNQQEIEKLKKK